MNLNELAEKIHKIAKEHGFWDEERNFGEMVALMHSELSEALEAHREGHPARYYKGKRDSEWVEVFKGPDDRYYFPASVYSIPLKSLKPEGVAVELADCLIRILDTMHSMDVDIDDIVREKVNFNARRAHKHGKAY